MSSARVAGAGGGPSLMFNGHMDTSYSGREPLARARARLSAERIRRGRAPVRPRDLEHEGRAACYVEALRALSDAGVQLRGDVMIAAVSGEIEKTQYGDAQGAEFRGYAAGSRYLVSHGGVADMCILGEPTESKVVLGHFGSLWLRIRQRRPFIHTAFSEGKRDQNSIVRMRDVLEAVLEWIPSWEDDPSNAYRGAKAIVNVGAVEGGFGWRVSRTPHRTDLFLDVRVPPTKEMATARSQVLEHGARPGRALPRARDRRRGVRDGVRAPRSPKTTHWSARSTPRTPRCSARARAGRHACGSPTPRSSRATGSRR